MSVGADAVMLMLAVLLRTESGAPVVVIVIARVRH